MIRWALRWIPRPWLIRLSAPLRWLAPLLYGGTKYTDPIDGKSYSRFLPYGYGGAIRPEVLAPGTHSLERHRLLWLYLQRFTDFFSRQAELLHIAPEQCFHARFKALSHLQVLSGDIESPLADLHFDLHAIPLENDRFDVVFCNHVLEHVSDDAQCLRELYRVMKPGGWGIFQIPWIPGRPFTDEDPTLTDPRERERRFGQYDHVRMYGEDYADRLKSAGFEVERVDLADRLEAEEYQRYRLPQGEPLFVVRKTLA